MTHMGKFHRSSYFANVAVVGVLTAWMWRLRGEMQYAMVIALAHYLGTECVKFLLSHAFRRKALFRNYALALFGVNAGIAAIVLKNAPSTVYVAMLLAVLLAAAVGLLHVRSMARRADDLRVALHQHCDAVGALWLMCLVVYVATKSNAPQVQEA